MGVAEAQPGHAGQEPALEPFEAEPEKRQQPEARGTEPTFRPALAKQNQRRGQGEVYHQQSGYRGGHRRRRHAEIVQAVVDPVDAEAEVADAEQPARQHQAARRPVDVDVPQQQRGDQDGERPPVERSESQRQQAPEYQARSVPQQPLLAIRLFQRGVRRCRRPGTGVPGGCRRSSP